MNVCGKICLALLLIFVCGTFQLTSAQRATPEETLHTFYHDFKRLQFRSIIQYTSGPAYTLYKKIYDYQYMYHQVPEHYSNMAAIMKAIRVETPIIDENWAYIECDWHLTVVRDSGDRQRQNKVQHMAFVLEKENNAWKIYNVRVISVIEL